MIMKIVTTVVAISFAASTGQAIDHISLEEGSNRCENFAAAEGADPELDQFEQTFETFTHEEHDESLACDPKEMDLMIYRSTHSAPVWGPFMRNLSQCAPGCKPVGYHAYRNQRRSCHYSGRALDVFGINCGGKTHYAISGGKYASMVQCMKRKMRVLYRNGPGRTSGHHDHAHFSLGCSVPGRPVYW